MLKNFGQAFNDFISDRTTHIGDNVLIYEKEYIEMSDKLTLLYKSIKELLPDGSKHLIDEYECTANCQLVVTEEVVYQQGLKDGIELKNILRLCN